MAEAIGNDTVILEFKAMLTELNQPKPEVKKKVIPSDQAGTTVKDQIGKDKGVSQKQ